MDKNQKKALLRAWEEKQKKSYLLKKQMPSACSDIFNSAWNKPPVIIPFAIHWNGCEKSIPTGITWLTKSCKRSKKRADTAIARSF